MISIYLAAPFIHKEQARAARDVLVSEGFEVTSRWIDLPSEGVSDAKDPSKQAYYELESRHDVEDVYKAEILIVLNTAKSEGKAAETGMALAWGKPIIIVGERTNIFHWLPLPIVPDLQGAIDLIKLWEANWKKQAEVFQAQLQKPAVSE